ncbi:MAG: hypothetical protein II936_10360, partial [Oscillospiraceae bacterium]|nr:hypothetical protein [Oscillospiraceae bacterium]
GIFAGIVDSIYVGEIKISKNDIGISHKQVNNFIENYAESRGIKGQHLKDTIASLEKEFTVAQDNVWSGADIGVSAKNHHLADLAHHPTPLGLVSALMVQFLRIGTFVNKDGEWHFIFVETTKDDIIAIVIAALITGVLNWLALLAEKKYEDDADTEIPGTLKTLIHIIASSPMIIEVIKCADNWFGHLVSEMGGSKQTAGAGMGIPGVFLSLMYELASLPILKDSGLPAALNSLYVDGKVNLRSEIPIYSVLTKQSVPVIINEVFVRSFFFISRLAGEIKEHNGLMGIDWKNIIPFGNRTIERMITVSSLTFTVADTADAAIHAAVESGGNWVIFSCRFASRFNFVGAGKAGLSVIREISAESEEAELIHEKMLLTHAVTAQAVQIIEEYKAALNARLTEYIAEDITQFLTGLDMMRDGLSTVDADRVIGGNVVIQRVLGREPQFTNQQEFDELMGSDMDLIL